MTYADLCSAALDRHLKVLGGFHPVPDDAAPAHCKTLLMLGPDEPTFWPVFTQSPEWQDGEADPMDRWSTRVIGGWAEALEATAIYPFGGPPFEPFYSWALRTGRVHASPVQLLVHDAAGLFVSFRGALALPIHVDLPPAPPSPCANCAAQPCQTACVSRALTPEGYNVPACKTFLNSDAGRENMTLGCNVRRACPVSQGFGRVAAQSAYHMQQFNGA